MSGREWQPGDVGAATVNGRPNVRLVAGWSKYDPQLRWCELSPRWADGDDDDCWFMPFAVTDARPLVVIDPEDREQVERLWREQETAIGLIREANPQQVGVSLIDALQLGLRRLTEPEHLPKPEEPTGLGAVVEDADSALWVRLDGPSHPGEDWFCGERNTRCTYSSIDAVRVLSEGVTP